MADQTVPSPPPPAVNPDVPGSPVVTVANPGQAMAAAAPPAPKLVEGPIVPHPEQVAQMSEILAKSQVLRYPRPAPTEDQVTAAQEEFDRLVVGAEEAYRQYILSHASAHLHDAILPLVDAVHPVRVVVAPGDVQPGDPNVYPDVATRPR